MRLVGPITTPAAAGGAGVATSNVTASLQTVGKLYGVFIRYNDSPPATTDVTIQTVAGALPLFTYLTVSNTNTDGFFLVRKAPVDAAGAAFASMATAEALPIFGTLKVTIAQANDNDTVDVWLFVE